MHMAYTQPFLLTAHPHFRYMQCHLQQEGSSQAATAEVIIDLTQDGDDTQEDAAKISGSGPHASTQPRSQPCFDPKQLGFFADDAEDDNDLALIDLTHM